MMTAKVFENGRSQAVRLPKECRFDTDEVAVNRIGDIVLLMPKTNIWSSFMQAIDTLIRLRIGLAKVNPHEDVILFSCSDK